MDYSKQSINESYAKLGTISKLNNKRFPFREVIKNVEKREVLEFKNARLLGLLKSACKNTICFLTYKNGSALLLNGEFHIVDMYEKEVKLKLEYNSNNKELYGGKLL